MFSRNQVFCLKNWKLWWASTTRDFNNFCWNFAHVPYLPMPTKGPMGFFLFCLDLELFAKIKKYLVFYTVTETRFINNSWSKLNFKNPTNPFIDIRKTETCAKFQQKIIDSTAVGARQSFQFFRQITWFLGNTRALSKFKYWILHHLISIIKLINN